MTPAAKSIHYFGIYFISVGFVLMVFPNVLLWLMRFELSDEVFPHVCGLLVMVIGFYYLVAARHDLVPFFRATIIGRSTPMVVFAVFVLLGLVKWQIMLFAVGDLVGAIWTYWALKKTNTNKAEAS